MTAWRSRQRESIRHPGPPLGARKENDQTNRRFSLTTTRAKQNKKKRRKKKKKKLQRSKSPQHPLHPVYVCYSPLPPPPHIPRVKCDSEVDCTFFSVVIDGTENGLLNEIGRGGSRNWKRDRTQCKCVCAYVYVRATSQRMSQDQKRGWIAISLRSNLTFDPMTQIIKSECRWILCPVSLSISLPEVTSLMNSQKP